MADCFALGIEAFVGAPQRERLLKARPSGNAQLIFGMLYANVKKKGFVSVFLYRLKRILLS